jgi:L-alanine-DL-glutamate epimerase-like enolase superfamily enzyme
MRPTWITEVTAEPLDLPLIEPFTIATGTQLAAHNVLVRLKLADGTTGLGEAAPFPAVSGETQEGDLAAIVAARPHLLGRDARSWRTIAGLLADLLPGAASARCGIEMALLDALSRHYHQPLCVFFGGAPATLHTDITITAGTAAEAAAAARSIAARGFSAIKVKVGALSPEEDAERITLIHREAPAARLLADANGGYDAGGALRLLEALDAASIRLALFEQPVPREDQAGMLEVARRSAVPICADESARSAADVVALARSGAARVINIKLMKTGLAEALSMWSVARAAGLQLMIGGMVESVLAMTCGVHFAAGLGGFDFVDLDTPMWIARHPFQGGFAQEGDRLDIAHVERGHGVTLP